MVTESAWHRLRPPYTRRDRLLAPYLTSVRVRHRAQAEEVESPSATLAARLGLSGLLVAGMVHLHVRRYILADSRVNWILEIRSGRRVGRLLQDGHLVRRRNNEIVPTSNTSRRRVGELLMLPCHIFDMPAEYILAMLLGACYAFVQPLLHKP